MVVESKLNSENVNKEVKIAQMLIFRSKRLKWLICDVIMTTLGRHPSQGCHFGMLKGFHYVPAHRYLDKEGKITEKSVKKESK